MGQADTDALLEAQARWVKVHDHNGCLDSVRKQHMLENPMNVVEHLGKAAKELSQAHAWAGETEAGVTNLNGPVRDTIYGLNTTIEGLCIIIEEMRDI